MFTFFKKILSPFSKISPFLGKKLRGLFKEKVGSDLLESLESLFYEADLGSEISHLLAKKISSFAKDTPIEEILAFVKDELLALFAPTSTPALAPCHVILVVGTNGSGKTTTIGKLACLYKREGKKVLIGAGDTFRAAAVEQLEILAQRNDILLVESKSTKDPSAVAFDAIASAKAKGAEVVLIDTAGRLDTKENLMEELSKITRVIKKQIPDAPHETLLILDATIGQNAIDQARGFHKATPITGLILSKLDGSAKGGVAINVQKELQIPIRFIGVGEKMEDLIPFDPEAFLDALLKTSD